MNDSKLIAEFMGVVFQDDENQYYDNNGLYIGEELHYHTSWDWLMPVIEKIMDMSFQEDGEYEDFYSIRDLIPDIGQTYKAVVEFIKEK